MVRSGDELARPGGYRMRFLTTREDSDGALLMMEVTYPERTEPPPLHLHPSQDETFEVMTGALHATVDGTERTYRAGDRFVIPAGTPHTMHAQAEEPTTFTWQVRPALRTQEMFEVIWRIAGDAPPGRGERMDLLQSAVLMHAYAPEFRLASPPRWVQRPVFAVLAPLGRLAGRRSRA